MWIAIVIGAAAVVAAGTWWAQRRATDAAAELLTEAVGTLATPPEVPVWPLEAPFAARPDAEPFPFGPERPTLVVLLHGMTPNRDLDPDVGTHAYARRYWGFAFVRALLDGRAPRLVDGDALTADTWTADVPGADAPDGDAVAYGLFLPSADANGDAAEGGGGTPGGADDEQPLRAVFVPVRDGSRGLGEQAIAVAAQIDAGLERYRAWLASTTDAAGEGADAGAASATDGTASDGDAVDDLGDRE
ncbi:MAG: hypothetical protein P1P87_07820, partial [Trueperaceae bacterium]|nr:hypothetical protein [Trueperaceae bacterium]